MPAWLTIIKSLSLIWDKDPFAITNYNMPTIRALFTYENKDQNHELSIH